MSESVARVRCLQSAYIDVMPIKAERAATREEDKSPRAVEWFHRSSTGRPRVLEWPSRRSALSSPPRGLAFSIYKTITFCD